jgi:hypothetical protein
MKPLKEDKPMKSQNEIAQIKEQIKYYFSQELQYDQSLIGGMRKKQIEKSLISWAKENK